MSWSLEVLRNHNFMFIAQCDWVWANDLAFKLICFVAFKTISNNFEFKNIYSRHMVVWDENICQRLTRKTNSIYWKKLFNWSKEGKLIAIHFYTIYPWRNEMPYFGLCFDIMFPFEFYNHFSFGTVLFSISISVALSVSIPLIKSFLCTFSITSIKRRSKRREK